MKDTLEHLKKAFDAKCSILENAQETLKREFIGIDKPIDSIIQQLHSWYLLSDIQDRPFIINLWGLTGVGKTSLVNRLVELLNYENHYYRIDLGNKKGNHSLNYILDELCENKIEKPVIIALDEFQHTRTIVGPQKSEVDDKNRVVWDLIDSGKINHRIYKFGVWKLHDTLRVLTRLLHGDIIVENGKIVKGWENCKSEPEYHRQKENLFIAKNNYEAILDLAGDELNLTLQQELKETLLQLNGEESIQFLKRVIKIASKPIERDFSKALIFIMGNLDEAYAMSSNYAVDICANDFYEQSLRITISDIKDALQERFRNEQIARLGNIHIIYPALSVAAYYGIIRKELEAISNKIYQIYAVDIEFDDSIATLVYQEGVFPTQGVRPVLTTINQLIRSNVSSILATYLKQQHEFTAITVSFYNKCQLKIDFYVAENIPLVKLIDISTDLKRHAINTQDDEQSITAVHESGHAIIAALVLNTLPKYVFSKTLEKGYKGFVYTHFNKDYIARNEIVKRAALFLGGIAAEELIFGKEHVTTGSGNDIADATQFVLRMLKKEGFGNTKLAYRPENDHNNYYYHHIKNVEKEGAVLIDQAFDLAKKTLQKEINLLLEMANYLSDHTHMKSNKIAEYVTMYAASKVNFSDAKNATFYRDRLKEIYAKKAIVDKNLVHHHPIYLNKH